MALSNDRGQIFTGKVVSHRGKTLTDIGSSPQYIKFMQNVYDATNSKTAIIPTSMEARPDLLAYAAYGSERLWWLIVAANSVYDYEVDLAAGNQILIPQV